MTKWQVLCAILGVVLMSPLATYVLAMIYLIFGVWAPLAVGGAVAIVGMFACGAKMLEWALSEGIK